MLRNAFIRSFSEFASRLQATLQSSFAPSHIQVLDDSHKHTKGPNSHYRVVVVSERFAGMGMVERHRAVQGSVREMFKEGLHSLAITAKTPGEWTGKVPGTPGCPNKHAHSNDRT